MGGSDFGDWEVAKAGDWDIPTATTLVLVGRTGNGKSATGNSILGNRVFKSRSSSSAITSTCELQKTTRPDGRDLRVVDTPGLFDPAMPPEYIGKEIMKCLDLAKDGVHALLLVLSVRNRFTAEEVAAVESLQNIFGEKVVKYMIVVFTGGDELEENDETLDEYLLQGAPEYLKSFLNRCGNRKVVFDNKTKDRVKKEGQVDNLLTVIDDMLLDNGGSPYANELFKEAQDLAYKSEQEKKKVAASGIRSRELQEIKRELEIAYAEQLKQLTNMVEDKLRLNAERLEERLASEQCAREAAEERAKLAKTQADLDIQALRDELEKAHREREEFKQKIDEGLKKNKQCYIL